MKKILICILALLAVAPAAWGQMKKSAKRGVGENGFNHAPEVEALAPGVSWTYNWSTNPARYVASQLRPGGIMEFVPMCWNGGFSEQALRDSLSKYPGTRYLLGFNEPNFKAQANMTPEQAAQRWPALEAIARDYNLQLVAPALNFPDGPINDSVTYQPKEWLSQFVEAYKKLYGKEPRMDYVALHSYMNSHTAMMNFIDDFARTFGKKVWLTEFCSWEGTVDSVSQLNSMVLKVQDLELDTMVYRYAWFKAKGTETPPYYRLLVNQNLLTHQPAWGTLSQLGQVYVNMSSYDTTYFHPAGAVIAAKDWVNSTGPTLEVNTDTQSSQKIQVGSFDVNNWAEYLVDVPRAGSYIFSLRLASEEFLFSPKIRIFANGQKVAEQVLDATGSVDKWKTQTMKAILPAGHVRIRIVSGQSTNCKFNWFRFDSDAGGDINGDGQVNVTDVTALINKILGSAAYDDMLCDLNHDGLVNVSDVTALINIILSK